MFDGAALNITAVSCQGVVGVGHLTCPDRLAQEQSAAFEELADAYCV